MKTNLVPVNSSMLKEVGYDPASASLFVRFNNGKLYRYINVPSAHHQSMMQAESVGKYLNANIKPNYQYEEIAE